MIFMEMHLILKSFEVICDNIDIEKGLLYIYGDNNPLSKIQSILRGRLAINHSAGQFSLPQSAVM